VDAGALIESSSKAASPAGSQSPVGDTEIQLASIWCDLLGFQTIGRDDDFFVTGGHSLLALRLFSRINRQFGCELPLSVLIAHPTIRSLASLVDRKSEAPPSEMDSPKSKGHQVTLSDEGLAPPMFCIHGGDGGVLFYRNLVGQLSGTFPLHAIESLELSSSDVIAPTSVKETAAAYVQHVLAKHPKGPFRLAGYSFGGLVAHEMAGILESMGHRVDFVGLFDTHNPTAESRAFSLPERFTSFWKQHQEIALPSRLARLGTRIVAGIRTNRQVRSGIHQAEANGPAAAHSDLRRVQVRESNWKAMKAYLPGPINGRLTLFKAMVGSDKFEWPNDYGWSSLTRSGLDIVPVPGEHLTLFEPENITALAQALEDSLNRVPSSPQIRDGE
ncbi:MAG: hypothetical protein CFE26_12480, partial [Verrucomicrobiales bacterium VVV1]